MKKEVITRLHKRFERCAHARDGVEYWLARELQELLGYVQWRRFEEVIERAKTACVNAGQAIEDHLLQRSANGISSPRVRSGKSTIWRSPAMPAT
ncbi:hypothetical protein RLIN73S_06085 [Rhodanobacter lindaniclasticus]